MAFGINLGNLLVHLNLDTTKYDRQMTKAMMKMKKTSDSFISIGKKMSLRVTAPIVAIGTASVYAFAKLEQQMANVNTMLDVQTTQYLPSYTAAIRSMSMEFGEGTATLTKGLYDILSASIAADKAIEVLDASVRAAKAGMTDTGVAADAITTIINAYSLSADQAADVSDLLFAIVKRGKTTFAELAPKIGMVASIAASAGVSLEDMGAALATMTRAGLATDKAVTSLRGIINGFLKPTDEARAMARHFGIELSSTTLQTIGLTGVLRKLTGVTAEQLVAMFPNIRALAGLAAALQQADQNAYDFQFMLNRAGLTQAAYTKMTRTLSFQLSQLKQGFIIVATSIGEVLLPYVKKATEWLQRFSKWWLDLSDSTRKFVVVMMVLMASIGPVLLIFGMLLKTIILLKVAFLLANAAVLILTGAFAGLFTVITAFAIGTYLQNEFKIVKQAGIILVESLWKGWEYVKFAFKQMVAGMRIAWDGLMNKMTEGLAIALDKIADGVAALEDMLDKLPGFEDTNLGADKVKAWAENLRAITDKAIGKEMWDENKRVLEENLQFITDATNTALKDIDEEFAVKELISPEEIAATAEALEKIRPPDPEETFFKKFKEQMTTAHDSLIGSMTSMGDIMVGTFNKASDTLTEFVMTGKANFADMARSIIADITRMIIQQMLFNALAAMMPGFGAGAGAGATPAITPHQGGVVGAISKHRVVPRGLFYGAPQLHDGLAADEFPAILQKGEVVHSKKDVTAFKEAEQTQVPQSVNLKVVNVMDKTQMLDAMSSPDGERTVINAIKRNRGVVSGVLR